MSSLQALLLAFCEWCNASFFGHAIRDSVWLFPFVEIFHLVALALLGATVLMLNLRLVGLGFRSDPVTVLARELRPYMLGSLAVMLLSGFLLFSTEAVKMYGNWAFQLKMLFLALAVMFTFTVHRRATDRESGSAALRWLAVIGSSLLWLAVGLGGRAIGYVTTAASGS